MTDSGSIEDEFLDFEIIQSDGTIIPAEPSTPKPVVEILLCPICQHRCEGSQELIEHYWGYCQKTRTYFDLHVDNWGVKI
jgi:hypothetical protein